MRDAPFALMVDVELEDTVPVGDAESDRVHAGFVPHRRERGANVRVQHGELELHVLDVGVCAPQADLGIELGDERGESLQITFRLDGAPMPIV